MCSNLTNSYYNSRQAEGSLASLFRMEGDRTTLPTAFHGNVGLLNSDGGIHPFAHIVYGESCHSRRRKGLYIDTRFIGCLGSGFDVD